MSRIVSGVLLGILIFLTGIRTMTLGLRAVAGPKLRWALRRFTANPAMGLITGAIMTAITQSSSATAAAAVGLVDAGLLTLEQALGIILGANIGTTLTVQLISFRWGNAAPLAICLGALAVVLGGNTIWRRVGYIVTGAGGLLWGIDLVALALGPLTQLPHLTRLILRWEKNPYSGILAGITLTAVFQSSSATIGVTMALAEEGLVGLSGGMAVVLGSNIGTVLTTLLASLGTAEEARQTAVADLLFNMLGVLMVLPLFTSLLQLLQASSTDVIHQLANGHTLFNLGTALVALPGVSYLARLVRRLVPT
ncbi:MAG: Na/Pi cotransporter family protein [Firmicutes bacterium]|nr:Na/Pi cotransporter family protein [Bacillota bacterium]